MVWTSLSILVATVLYVAIWKPEMLSFLPEWLQSGRKDSRTPVTQSNEEQNAIESDADNEGTPKPKSATVAKDVPVLSLNSNEEADEASATSPAPSFPATNSSKRVSTAPSSMMPPPRPTPAPARSNASSLMPPPPRPVPSQSAPPPSASSGLRVPSTGPLPNREPPANSQQRVSSSLSPNGNVPTPNPRGKVLLSPGHSPMDWAALTRSGNLSGVGSFQKVMPSELKKMTGRKGKPAWSSWQGKVYNITPYLPFHPGGEAELMKAAGRDGTKLFMDVHPWVNWENMLGSCLVGVLVPEGSKEEESPLDAID